MRYLAWAPKARCANPTAWTLTILSVVLACWTWSVFRQRNAAPTVDIVGGVVYDAGIVGRGRPVVHTFVVSNPHPFPIGLSAPTAGCACTTATSSSSVIPPNGRVQVTLTVEPEDGKLSGSASIVTTHGAERAETWLMVTGDPPLAASNKKQPVK